jgi:hypothetical protein
MRIQTCQLIRWNLPIEFTLTRLVWLKPVIQRSIAPMLFASYSRRVVEALGDRIGWLCTINEANLSSDPEQGPWRQLQPPPTSLAFPPSSSQTKAGPSRLCESVMPQHALQSRPFALHYPSDTRLRWMMCKMRRGWKVARRPCVQKCSRSGSAKQGTTISWGYKITRVA